MTHVNNVNSILAQEFSGSIRGRQWLELNRNDEQGKLAQAIIPRDQTKRLNH